MELKEKNGQINKIKKESENTLFLILNDKYNRNWQTPENVMDYLKQNWKKTYEIDKFDVYWKK